jgi:hypothetical protein
MSTLSEKTTPEKFTLRNIGIVQTAIQVIGLIFVVCIMARLYNKTPIITSEGWDNPYAARLVQCATDGLPGTQSGANCWGQLGSQGCPPGLPKCGMGEEQFLGNGHGEQPVFYSLGNEQVVAKSTRPNSKNNNLRNQTGSVEGYTVSGRGNGGPIMAADALSIQPWNPTENMDDVATAIGDEIYGPESYINY